MITDLSTLINQAAELIVKARSVVAFTGAGISTPSGIPDFRSPKEGLWEGVDAVEVAGIRSFRRDPYRFYDWLHPLVKSCRSAEPNAAHLALASLERAGKLDAIITQNIDELHEAAGSRVVHKVHGDLGRVDCLYCRFSAEADPFFEPYVQTRQLPHCPNCGGVLKPAITLFGESLPSGTWMNAYDAADSAEVILAVGTSLTVHPAASLPALTLDNGGKLIIINFTATPYDDQAAVTLRGDAARILPALVQAIGDK